MRQAAQAARNYGTGRRKRAIARVWIKPGSGSCTINGREAKAYVGRDTLLGLVEGPMKVVDLFGRLDVMATCKGGGLTGQAGAVSQGIARAIVEMDADLRVPLRRSGFLTRDPRVKERKKYGRKRARRGFQYVKR